MDPEINIEDLVKDRQKFDEVVYTPLDKALEILKKRWEDEKLKKEVESYLLNSIPHKFEKGFMLALFRPIATPNFEIHRFISIADGLDYNFVIGEYLHDKFVTENLNKFSLGKLVFYKDAVETSTQEVRNIIDFNGSNGENLCHVETLWGEALVDFHHELFFKRYPQYREVLFDGSDWVRQNGHHPKKYYKQLLALFVRNGILFENFLLNEKELSFTKDLFLPAFFEVWKKTGVKPLIVALEPTEIEDNEFWLSYPHGLLPVVDSHLLDSAILK